MKEEKKQNIEKGVLDRDFWEEVEDVRDTDRYVTGGERVFNEVTYRGVDWLLNSAAGVAFTYWAARTKAGEKYFGKPVYNFFHSGLKPFVKNEQKLDVAAGWGRAFAGIMFGGFVTIPPIMALEKNKLGFVQKVDKMIYGEDQVKNDPRFAFAYEDIKNEPEKDFTGGIVTRFAAITPLIAASMAFSPQLDKYMYAPIGKMSKAAAKNMGIEGKAMKARMQLDEDGKMVSDWDYLHQKIGFDFGLTIFYAYLHEFSYKLYSEYFNDKEKQGEAKDLPHPKQLSPHLAAAEETQVSHSSFEDKKRTLVCEDEQEPNKQIAAKDIAHRSALQQQEVQAHV
ncbi:MAG: hypothetical protein MRY32_02105 [Rickettsiales bacterium]|nr:hypothetical protein [Rickettsiales bacterium]